jgi:hypothetical protein
VGKNIWIFGDSFSTSFKTQIEGMCSYDYVKYKGYQPKVFSEIISETFDLNLKDYSHGGSSNQGIFNKFVLNLNQIDKNDIFIFGWTQNVRFNVATKTNGYLPVILGGADENTYDFVDIPFQSLVDFADNRLRYSSYWIEVINYIKVINHILKNNTVYHWTWVNPSNEYYLGSGNYQKEYYDLLVPFKKYPSITEETNNLIDDLHWGEKAHSLFASEIMEKIKIYTKLL